MDKILYRVKDAEDWNTVLKTHDKKLLVVDAHKEWCGPCTVLEPTFKRIFAGIENAEHRLLFISLSTGLNIEGIEEVESCKPRFLLFLNNAIVATVDGANAPELEKMVKQHVPDAQPTEEEG